MELATPQRTFRPFWWVLYGIILTEGYVSISTEILTLRQLLAFVGSSIVVTSIIIGLFLLCLAAGYQRSSHINHHYRAILRRNFSIAALILGIGLSYPFVALFFKLTLTTLGDHTLIVLIVYLLLIVTPLVYLLGYTLPIAMNLFKQDQPAGSIGGRALSISTAGAFLGAILTSLVLLHYLGVAWSIFIATVLLLLMALALCQPTLSLAYQLIFTVVTLYCIYVLNVYYEKQNFVLTDNYANYQVLSLVDAHIKILSINRSSSSMITTDFNSYPYIALIQQLLFSKNHLALHGKKILVIGAGGFTLTAKGEQGNQVTYIDIDKKIKNVVRHHFLNAIHGKFIADDARVFLETTQQKFSAIVSDPYSSQMVIPSHLLTEEYFRQMKHHLTPNGVAIFNIIARPTLADPYSKHIDNTLRRVFGNCMSIPLNYSNRITNIIYLCNKQKNGQDTTTYRDDLNNASREHFNVWHPNT